jgi:ferredoxin--NADP+ reductase
MNPLGDSTNLLRIAIVGAGPSGFHAAEALFKAGLALTCDLYEQLPAPYGLVRHGVAPDHAKLKQATTLYDRIAAHPGFSYLGNVAVGQAIQVADLRAAYHAVVLTYGAQADRRLDCPGEDLPGSHTATEFVGWYNGHPHYRERRFDLTAERAVVIGQGDVATDVARILAKTEAELAGTDIAAHALAALAESRVREIWVVGRRGPVQAKATAKDLREFGELAACVPVVDPAELALDPASAQELADPRFAGGAANLTVYQGFAAAGGGAPAATAGATRRCVFRFLLRPVEILGQGRVEGLVLERCRLEGEPGQLVARGTGERLVVPCGLVFRAVGYRTLALPGLPFDPVAGHLPHERGRVIEAGAAPGLYTAGWSKRGPTGHLPTNRACAYETVATLLEDLPRLAQAPRPGAAGILPLLAARGVRVVDWAGWKRIDAAEVARGAASGKPREKFTAVAEMLAAL